jgi:hypothetical protein
VSAACFDEALLFAKEEEQGRWQMAYFLRRAKNKSKQSELCSDVAEKEWMRVRVWNPHKEDHERTSTIRIVLPNCWWT